MLFRSLLGCVAVLFIANSLQAQGEKFNPYAPVVDEPAIRDDGKINWPAFFKAARMEQRFQGYFQSGSCVGTSKRVNEKLAANKVDVNALPRTNLQVQAVSVQPGVVSVVDRDGKQIDLFIHPKGVSQVEVTGEVTAKMVAPGMVVRFVGEVDSHARGQGPIAELEVISNLSTLKAIEVTAQHRQTIVGKVERLHHGQLTVNVGTGSLRKLTFSLPAETPVSVHGSTLDLIGPGDVIDTEGPIYAGDHGDRSLFAEKLTARKSINKKTDTLNQQAAR